MARTTRHTRARDQTGAGSPAGRNANQRVGVPTSHFTRDVVVLARWDVALAAFAWLSWVGAHAGGPVSDIAIPAWIVSGIVLGLVRPRLGLILVILVVPYLGGAADPPEAEVLRVVPILGAAVRVAVDRLRGELVLGSPRGEMTAVALLASGLFILTAFTAYLDRPDAEAQVLAALPWLLGAPVAFLAAWITAAHVSKSSDTVIADVVLVSTILACVFALAAWAGVPGTGPFAYPTEVTGRLSALGYPTPTGMGVAIALPFAVAAAGRRHMLGAMLVLGLGLTTVVLTGSRGPLIALGVGGLVGFAFSGRLSIRRLLAGVGIAAVVSVALVAVKYGTTPDQIRSVFAEVTAGDVQRVQSWRDAVEVVLLDPLTGGGWRSLSQVQAADSGGLGASHNMVLASFADGGLPLGLAFSAVLLYSLLTMWRHRRSIAPYAIAAATTLLVAGLWDVPHLRSYAAITGGLALGIVARPMSDAREPGRTSSRRTKRAQRLHADPAA